MTITTYTAYANEIKSNVKEALRSTVRVRLGFSLDGFQVYDYGNDEGFCYYDTAGHSFYTCVSSETAQWWERHAMTMIKECPYCDCSVGCFNESEEEFVKRWLGKHLALFHKPQVEKYLLKMEQTEEYASGTVYC